jgi:hypothetical protein
MPNLSNELKITPDDNAVTVCKRLCNSLKLSGNREKDEEFVMKNICRVLSEKRHQNVYFLTNPRFSKLENLRERFFLAIDSQEELDAINEYIEELLDNMYPKN